MPINVLISVKNANHVHQVQKIQLKNNSYVSLIQNDTPIARQYQWEERGRVAKKKLTRLTETNIRREMRETVHRK